MTTSMSLSLFLHQLEFLGVQLALEQGRLSIKAPRGVVSDEIRLLLEEHRDELIAWLSSDASTPPAPSVISAPVPIMPEGQLAAENGTGPLGPPSRAQRSNHTPFLEEIRALDQELGTRHPAHVALHLETTGLDPRQHKVVALVVGIPGRVSVLNLRPYYALAEDEQVAWRAALQGLLHRCFERSLLWVGQNLILAWQFLFIERSLLWVGQNLILAWQFLFIHFDVRLDPVYDVMLAEQVLLGQEQHPELLTLHAMAARYQGQVRPTSRAKLIVHKEAFTWFHNLDQRPQEWAAPFPEVQQRALLQKVEVPYRLMLLQQRALERQGLTEVAERENDCLPALAEIEVLKRKKREQGEQGAEKEGRTQDILASPGHVLIPVDLSIIEVSILAELSGDKTLLRLFAEERDLYAETAKQLFHLPHESNTNEHRYNGMAVREIAKTLHNEVIHGMSIQHIAHRLQMSVEETRYLLRAYFETYSGVKRWLRLAVVTARKQGYAASLTGRKHVLTHEVTQSSLVHIARTYPLQATLADILKQTLAALYEVLPSIHGHTILATQNELVLECPTAHAELGGRLLKEILVWACRLFLKSVPILAPDVRIATKYVPIHN